MNSTILWRVVVCGWPVPKRYSLRLKIKLAGLKGDDAVAALLDKSDRDEKGFQIQGQLGQGGSKKR